jgi:hypothetical protein
VLRGQRNGSPPPYGNSVFVYRPIEVKLPCLSMALQPFGLWPRFQFLNLYTVGGTAWTGDQPVARPLQNKRTQIFMPLAGFEPTIPVFEQTKKVMP